MYLPLAAVIAAVVIGGFLLGRRWMPSPRVGMGVAAIALAACVGVLAAETRDETACTGARSACGEIRSRSDRTTRGRESGMARLADAGRLADAEVQFRTAIAFAPDDPAARVRMGAILAQQRRIDEAIRISSAPSRSRTIPTPTGCSPTSAPRAARIWPPCGISNGRWRRCKAIRA